MFRILYWQVLLLNACVHIKLRVLFIGPSIDCAFKTHVANAVRFLTRPSSRIICVFIDKPTCLIYRFTIHVCNLISRGHHNTPNVGNVHAHHPSSQRDCSGEHRSTPSFFCFIFFFFKSNDPCEWNTNCSRRVRLFIHCGDDFVPNLRKHRTLFQSRRPHAPMHPAIMRLRQTSRAVISLKHY